MLELFKGDKGGIKRNCQVEILADVVLPQAISISDGVWAVATQKEVELSMVCDGKTTKTKVIPLLTMVELPLGCSAFGMSMSLPSPLLSRRGKIRKEKVFCKIYGKQSKCLGRIMGTDCKTISLGAGIIYSQLWITT